MNPSAVSAFNYGWDILEMGVISANILRWRTAVSSGDIVNFSTFNAAFDPADVVEKALKVKTDAGNLELMTLKEVDKAPLQRDFEKGFLVAWIELGAVSHIPISRDIARDKLHDYGLSLGIKDIDVLLDKYIPDERPAFQYPAGI